MKHLKTFESISISNKDLDDYANMSKVQKYKKELLFKSYVDLLFKHKDKWGYLYDSDMGSFKHILPAYELSEPNDVLNFILDNKSTESEDLLEMIEKYYIIFSVKLLL